MTDIEKVDILVLEEDIVQEMIDTEKADILEDIVQTTVEIIMVVVIEIKMVLFEIEITEDFNQ
jgi:hypothetical protein